MLLLMQKLGATVVWCCSGLCLFLAACLEGCLAGRLLT